MLAAVDQAGFIGSGVGIEAFVGPVVEHGFEDFAQIRRLEGFDVIAIRLAIGVIEEADEHFDGAVMVDGAEDVVEVDGAIEKSPTDIAHEGAQEGVDLHDVAIAGQKMWAKYSSRWNLNWPMAKDW